MFHVLSEKLTSVLRRIKGKVRLSPHEMEEEITKLRIALLEADVNLAVARAFVANIRHEAENLYREGNLTSAESLTRLIQDEIVRALGGDNDGTGTSLSLRRDNPILIMGLQGSGKTTTAVKLAYRLKNQGFRPILVCLDTKRPAALKQLNILARNAGVDSFSYHSGELTEMIKSAQDYADSQKFKPVIFDTAGRLHIDEEEISQLREIKSLVAPGEALLVADASTGQDAVNIAKTYEEKVGLTGIILTKADSDAKGGAALSIYYAIGKPIRYIGTGEKIDDLEEFEPKRWAKRLIGLGDLETFAEKVSMELSKNDIQNLQEDILSSKFTIESFLKTLKTTKTVGNLISLINYLPGVNISKEQMEEGILRMKQFEAIALSMTKAERQKPSILNASRKRRIARGSGTTVQQVNLFLKQFEQMQSTVEALKMPLGRRKNKKRRN